MWLINSEKFLLNILLFCLMPFLSLDKGQLFGWGSSEFGQLSSAAEDHTYLNVPRHLPFKHLGKVVKTAASSSMCAVLNGNQILIRCEFCFVK